MKKYSLRGIKIEFLQGQQVTQVIKKFFISRERATMIKNRLEYKARKPLIKLTKKEIAVLLKGKNLKGKKESNDFRGLSLTKDDVRWNLPTTEW